MDMTFKNDFARGFIFFNFSHIWRSAKVNNVDCINKDSDISQSLRKKGNEMYAKRYCDKEYEEIHEYYSRSIAFAPIDSDDLALAYGNRSALLHRIGKNEESILDIDRALEINKSDTAKIVKLLCRKVECLAALGSSESQKVYQQVEYLLPEILKSNQNEKSILDNMKKAEIALKKLHQVPNVKNKDSEEHMLILKKKELQNPFDSVAIQLDEMLGRHLIVATRDIKPGEIIFVEKPYVGCLNSNRGHIYCGHCFTKTWASIPCDFCNWCMFCSKECKDSAWMNYHDTECSVISYVMAIENNIDYHHYLSLRSLIMGVKESGSIINFITDIKSVDNGYIDELSNKGTLTSNGFKSIYSLCRETPEKFLRKYACDTVLILGILCKYTNFFGQNMNFTDLSDLQKNVYEDVLSIGSILLKLCCLRTHSSFSIVEDPNSNCKRSNGSVNGSIADCSKGACISSLSYFINHSCYPNVKKCVTEDYKVIIFSSLPIKKNTQLLMAYQKPFFEVENPVRQLQLYENFGFVCDCVACDFDWPTIKELWSMPKDNPELYIKNYNKLESDLYDKFDKLVRPIIIDCRKTQYNQATVKKISTAIEQAVSCLQQPSVVICELMICLQLTFEKLYCLES